MIGKLLNIKAMIFCFLLSYFFLAIGIAALFVPLHFRQGVAMAMTAGMLVYIIIAYTASCYIVWFWLVKILRGERKSLSRLVSVIVFVLSLVLILFLSAIVYGVAGDFLDFKPSQLANDMKWLIICYRLMLDLISLLLSLLLASLIMAPLYIYRRLRAG